MNLEREVEQKGENRQSAFFYGNRNAGNTTIAEAEDQHGNLYQLVSTGEIKVKVDGEIYRNNEIETLIEEKGLTDHDLNSDKVEILSNNWFEVIWHYEDGNRWNSEIGEVAHLYKEGIQMLEKYAKNCYAEPENQTEVTA